jgi:hypothetical protein
MARGTGAHTAHIPIHTPTGEPSHPSLTKIIQTRAEEGSYIWEPRMVGLPRNGKHGLCMYSYLALGSHATVTLNESSHFQALLVCLTLSSLCTSFSPLSPPPIPTNVLLKENGKEKSNNLHISFVLSAPTTSPLPLVTLSFYFERFHSPPH